MADIQCNPRVVKIRFVEHFVVMIRVSASPSVLSLSIIFPSLPFSVSSSVLLLSAVFSFPFPGFAHTFIYPSHSIYVLLCLSVLVLSLLLFSLSFRHGRPLYYLICSTLLSFGLLINVGRKSPKRRCAFGSSFKQNLTFVELYFSLGFKNKETVNFLVHQSLSSSVSKLEKIICKKTQIFQGKNQSPKCRMFLSFLSLLGPYSLSYNMHIPFEYRY